MTRIPILWLGQLLLKRKSRLQKDITVKLGVHTQRSALLKSVASQHPVRRFLFRWSHAQQLAIHPCVDAIIESGIKLVYVGTLDPNPVHAGRVWQF